MAEMVRIAEPIYANPVMLRKAVADANPFLSGVRKEGLEKRALLERLDRLLGRFGKEMNGLYRKVAEVVIRMDGKLMKGPDDVSPFEKPFQTIAEAAGVLAMVLPELTVVEAMERLEKFVDINVNALRALERDGLLTPGVAGVVLANLGMGKREGVQLRKHGGVVLMENDEKVTESLGSGDGVMEALAMLKMVGTVQMTAYALVAIACKGMTVERNPAGPLIEGILLPGAPGGA